MKQFQNNKEIEVIALHNFHLPTLANHKWHITKALNSITWSQKFLTSPMITTKYLFGRLRFTLSSLKLSFPSFSFDHEKDASWKVIALSSKISSTWTLDGTRTILFPWFGMYSGHARNLLNLPVDTMAWKRIKENINSSNITSRIYEHLAAGSENLHQLIHLSPREMNSKVRSMY